MMEISGKCQNVSKKTNETVYKENLTYLPNEKKVLVPNLAELSQKVRMIKTMKQVLLVPYWKVLSYLELVPTVAHCGR
jgi:hypothetical protein